MTCGIYGIRNVANGKWYVGQSVSIAQRKIGHFSALRRGCHRNEHLQFSFLKYGEAVFEFRVLEVVPEDMLDVRERSWISFYRSDRGSFGYNLSTGGRLNQRCSPETRRKMSEGARGRGVVYLQELGRRAAAATRGKPLSEEHRKKISEAHKGKQFSVEHRKKLSECAKKRKYSAETRRKLSEAGRRRIQSLETRKKIADSNRRRATTGQWREKHRVQKQ